MIHLLVGHRGAGKTSFLKKLPLKTFDLDKEIEQGTGLSIAELLARGEAFFREAERTVLRRLVQEMCHQDVVIAVGAGFEGPLPEGVQVTWLKRVTDRAGRCFLNRPRLDKKLSPWEEYRERFPLRERRFADWAIAELTLPEGYQSGFEDFFSPQGWSFPYELTLLPENFRAWPTFYERRRHWNLRHFELREDLLSEDEIGLAVASIPKEQILFAKRRPGGNWPSSLKTDWALELGPAPLGVYSVSLHEREEDFASTLERCRAPAGVLQKLAVEVKDFTELQQGHAWWQEDSTRRAFLPRSANGRWRWYRSLFGPKMPIHFFREGSGSGLDQPLLWQLRLQPEFRRQFAAVLGSPVEHSRSPLEHREFFKDIPFVAIDLPEADFTVALGVLRELGLSFAAVTAPLKKLAWASATEVTPEARRAQAANSLYLDSGVLAHNTDVLALREIAAELGAFAKIWLWGGGGIKGSVREAWPEVHEISARQGTNEPENPDLVIWATGRARPFVWPRTGVRPRLILDLNYGEDSPGLEWAVREGLPYQSGSEMFFRQAAAQRDFWSACDRRLKKESP